MNFKDKLREKILYYLPDFNPEILEKGLEKFELQQFSAGEYLIKAGEVAKGVFIAEKSISRAYQMKENGEEKTMWIEPEMKFITDFSSYKFGTPSIYSIHLYEDSEVFLIKTEDLKHLYTTYHDWARFGVSIVEEYLIYIFYMTNLMVDNDAKANYSLIEQQFPRFLQVVPLKHIASRFNVSPVTISRIRANKS